MPLLFLAASFLLIFFTFEFYFEYKTFECNWAKVLARVTSFRTNETYIVCTRCFPPPFWEQVNFLELTNERNSGVGERE